PPLRAVELAEALGEVGVTPACVRPGKKGRAGRDTLGQNGEEVAVMRTLFVILLVLVVGAVGLGFYRGWFSFSTSRDPETDRPQVQLSVDQEKMKGDTQKAKEKVGAAAGQAKEKVGAAAGRAKEN